MNSSHVPSSRGGARPPGAPPVEVPRVEAPPVAAPRMEVPPAGEGSRPPERARPTSDSSTRELRMASEQRRSRAATRLALSSRESVRQAVLLREVIGPPASLWGPRDGPPGLHRR